jgi:hypothetical protein
MHSVLIIPCFVFLVCLLYTALHTMCPHRPRTDGIRWTWWRTSRRRANNPHAHCPYMRAALITYLYICERSLWWSAAEHAKSPYYALLYKQRVRIIYSLLRNVFLLYIYALYPLYLLLVCKPSVFLSLQYQHWVPYYCTDAWTCTCVFVYSFVLILLPAVVCAKNPCYLLLYIHCVLIINCFICEVSALFTALYAKRPYYLLL